MKKIIVIGILLMFCSCFPDDFGGDPGACTELENTNDCETGEEYVMKIFGFAIEHTFKAKNLKYENNVLSGTVTNQNREVFNVEITFNIGSGTPTNHSCNNEDSTGWELSNEYRGEIYNANTSYVLQVDSTTPTAFYDSFQKGKGANIKESAESKKGMYARFPVVSGDFMVTYGIINANFCK